MKVLNNICQAITRVRAQHRNYLLALSLLAAVILCTPTVRAVEFEGEVFLQGDFVEVGIHSAGSFGTSNTPPEGFHALPTNRLGFVADPGKDGWDAGTPPQSGDFFVPGTPEEGFAIEWTTDGVETTFGNFGLMGLSDIPVTSLVETSSGDVRSAVWQGDAVSETDPNEKLRVTQTVRFRKGDLFFVINVVLTNIGTVPLESLEYMRNVDPDQEQPITGDFTTSNYVSGTRLAVGKGLVHGITCGLGTNDARAVASVEGFSNRDPDAILDSPRQPTEADPSIRDEGIALAFRFGTLAPGQSVSIDYAYILNEADLDVALSELSAISILQPTGTASGTNVLFQATTNDLPNTTRLEFFVNGTSIGTDTTPDAGGVFQRSFNSTTLPNGIATLRVVATFRGGTVLDKTTTVNVDNSGPRISFATPTDGAALSGDAIPVRINVLSPSQPPVRVSFFRETSATGSIFLGEDSSAPFESSFGVSDLPAGETVIIKAVAADSLNRLTSIQVSGTTTVVTPSGRFTSFLVNSEGREGTISVNLNEAGSFSGVVVLKDVRRLSIRGALDSEGRATIDVPEIGPVTLQLISSGGPQFRVTVTRGETVYDGTAVLSANGKAHAGSYTTLLPPDPAKAGDSSVPKGHGFAVTFVNSSGNVRVVGVLADGVKFGTGSAIQSGGTAPLFAGIYGGRTGRLQGVVTFRNNTGSDFDGTLNWLKPPTAGDAIYPAGFNANIPAIGSRYKKPSRQTGILTLDSSRTVTFTFTEGDLESAIQANAMIPSSGQPTVTRPLRSLSLIRASGLFSGYFVHDDGHSKFYRGIAFQKQNRGAGFFIGIDLAGNVGLEIPD